MDVQQLVQRTRQKSITWLGSSINHIYVDRCNVPMSLRSTPIPSPQFQILNFQSQHALQSFHLLTAKTVGGVIHPDPNFLDHYANLFHYEHETHHSFDSVGRYFFEIRFR